MIGLYCHIPFCVKKCPYCHFYSVSSRHLIPGYLRAVKREAALYRANGAFSRLISEGVTFDTLYLGGGTPSVLASDMIADLITHFRACFPFSDDVEMTMEVNPGDISSRHLEVLLKAGINRLNIGVQSFDSKSLRFLGRRHTEKESKNAIRIARDSGVHNLGIDLIYGIPGQTMSSWMKDLEEAIGFRPEHISCYQLTMEDDTPFGRRSKDGLLSVLTEDLEFEFFMATSQGLSQAGYEHYEVSNFARETAFRSRHNGKYWDHTPYLGLGPAAHSFSGRERWWNPRSIDQYCRAIEEDRFPIQGKEMLTREELRLETLYIGFRTKDGLDLRRFKDGFGQDLRSEHTDLLSLLKSEGKIIIREGTIHPTLEGMAVADALTLLF